MLDLGDILSDFLHGRYCLQDLEYDFEIFPASEFGHGCIPLFPRQAFRDESRNVETRTLPVNYLRGNLDDLIPCERFLDVKS